MGAEKKPGCWSARSVGGRAGGAAAPAARLARAGSTTHVETLNGRAATPVARWGECTRGTVPQLFGRARANDVWKSGGAVSRGVSRTPPISLRAIGLAR